MQLTVFIAGEDWIQRRSAAPAKGGPAKKKYFLTKECAMMLTLVAPKKDVAAAFKKCLVSNKLLVDRAAQDRIQALEAELTETRKRQADVETEELAALQGGYAAKRQELALVAKEMELTKRQRDQELDYEERHAALAKAKQDQELEFKRKEHEIEIEMKMKEQEHEMEMKKKEAEVRALEAEVKKKEAEVDESGKEFYFSLIVKTKNEIGNSLSPRDRLFLEGRLLDNARQPSARADGATPHIFHPEKELTLNAFAEKLGHRGATTDQLMKCGRCVADVYRSRHGGVNPDKTGQFVDGAERDVNCYKEIQDDACVRAGIDLYFKQGGKFGK